jgi:hypothetical protein
VQMLSLTAMGRPKSGSALTFLSPAASCASNFFAAASAASPLTLRKAPRRGSSLAIRARAASTASTALQDFVRTDSTTSTAVVAAC